MLPAHLPPARFSTERRARRGRRVEGSAVHVRSIPVVRRRTTSLLVAERKKRRSTCDTPTCWKLETGNWKLETRNLKLDTSH